jgi:hypothetical protein
LDDCPYDGDYLLRVTTLDWVKVKLYQATENTTYLAPTTTRTTISNIME